MVGSGQALGPRENAASAASNVSPQTEAALTNATKDRSRPISVLTFKTQHVLVSMFSLWFLFLHLCGIYFFCKGFLLTRLVLDGRSDCAILPSGGPSGQNEPGLGHGCWHPKKFERAVVILIDALRYDFTIPFKATDDTQSPSYFHNSFPVLYDTARRFPEHAFLLPFIADPPTTTLQRLKALTTGTLPTFIEAGTNFAGTAIEEDNILLQLRAAEKNIVHLGDDTWHSLFPGYFDPNLTRAYDSFNVRDLHTVDNGVIEHIMPLLATVNPSKWDVIIGHFLGVDHAGHRYGPDHPAMAEKLRQMNEVISDIKDLLDDETLLVVMGDHGMDVKGDHGGESDEEIEAALWLYSKRPVFGRTDSAFIEPPRTAKERPVRQIDLVPTMSLLLGLPIPFNNLGRPIEEAFAGSNGNDWNNLALVNSLSLDQIRRYDTEYSKSRSMVASPRQRELLRDMDQAQRSALQGKWKQLYHIKYEYQKETLHMYRDLWATFDIADMVHGIEILAGSLIALVAYPSLLRGDGADIAPPFLRNIGIGSVIGLVIGILLSGASIHFTILSISIYGMSMGGLLAFGFSFFQAKRMLVYPSVRSIWSWLSLIFTLSQAIGFASNSYTIHEDSILLFFLTTFGVISCLSSLRLSSRTDRILGTYHSVIFIVLTRVASFSRLCREEQMPHCRSTFYASSTSSTSSPWQLFVPYAIAIILPEIVKAFYKGTASYEGSAGFWIGFSFRMGLLLIAIVWTIDAAENGDWLGDEVSSTFLETGRITIARCVLAIAIAVGLATFIFAKPCINISVTQKEAADPSPTTGKPQVKILGYANVFGSRYFLCLPVLVLVAALLLPPMGQFSLAICSWQILCLLEILDTNGLSISPRSASAIGPVILGLLGSYHFFKTGHQAVLSSIQWNVAFIPLATVQYPWSPLLVVMNSFGAQILCATAVPLTVLWKRPVSKPGSRGIWGDVFQALLTHTFYYATIQMATTLWAGHLRRHLMLYRVFMPRFLLGSVVLVIVDVILLCLALSAVRITSMSVAEIFGY